MTTNEILETIDRMIAIQVALQKESDEHPVIMAVGRAHAQGAERALRQLRDHIVEQQEGKRA